MFKYKSFTEVPVWKKAHEATLQIYHLTNKFPKEELYGLTSQIRRSALSVCANIVEGLYRNSTKELIQFLYNARGSTGETIYHSILARDLKYISLDEYSLPFNTYEEIAKQLNGWIRSLRLRL